MRLRRPFKLAFLAAVCAAVAAAAAAGPAPAADPGRWIETGHSDVPLEYFQGVASRPNKTLFFDGLFLGLYRTDHDLVEDGRVPNVIPPEVSSTEGYSHIGDITWDNHESGRVILPLECFSAVICRHGAFGVADPDTLAWRYYVNLDTTFIDKAMWAAVSPDHRLVWTSSGSGKDLLAYRTRDIRPENAGPDGPRLVPVRRLVGAVPPSGITGAVFYKGRLLLAGQDTGPFQVWSVDLTDGSRELEIERHWIGESEGLDLVKVLDGELHWLITPFRSGGQPPTFGNGHSALVHFVPAK
jgi:hypothetical protein